MVSPTLSFEETRALLAPVAGPVDKIPAEIDIVIVGAGPAGLTAANLLGRYGVKALVVERNHHTADLPKAIVVDDEYMRLLHRLGLGAQMDANSSQPFGIHFSSPLGFALVKVPGFVTPNGFGNRHAVSQPMFEKILLEGARRHETVTLAYGAGVTAIEEDSSSVSITLTDSEGAGRIVRAKYALACDGARSFVRTCLGIPFEGRSLDQPHLVVDLAEVPDQVNFSRFICNPRRPLNCVLGPYGGRRIEFMLLPGEDHAAMATDESVRRLVDLHTPYRDMPVKIIRRAVYGLAERIAAQFQKDRVFLLGDAAHIMPPFGGQGMNSGARDAANLCWKLAAVLHGDLQPAVLATYDQERREHVRQTVDYSVRVGKIANIRFWPLALLRDAFFAIANLSPAVRQYFAEMRYLPKPLIRDGILVHDHALPKSSVGRILPRWTLNDGAGRESAIDSHTGMGWTLVGAGVPRDDIERVAHGQPWDRLAPRLVSISPSKRDGFDFAFAGERGRDVFDASQGLILVLRPDNVVAGAARPEALATLAAALAGKPGF